MTLTRPFTAIGFTVILALTSSEVAAQTHGQVMSADTDLEAWNAMGGQWQPVEAWWLAYASVSEGRASCIFSHNRWRRAQDVRRWDPVFNQILVCPTVCD